MNRISNHIGIIGGGPAGLTSAILLAKEGWEVTLFERRHYPHNKVCGEFVSAESWPMFQILGIVDAIQQSHPQFINELLISNSTGLTLKTKLPNLPGFQTGGLGLSRGILDSILYEKAKSLGVNLKIGYSAFQEFEDGDKTVLRMVNRETGKNHDFSFRYVIYATGRQFRNRDSISTLKSKNTSDSLLYGVKAHFQNVLDVGNKVELHSYRYGYIGLAGINQQKTNLCFVVKRKYLESFKGNLDGLVGEIVELSPVLSKKMKNAVRDSVWYTTGPLESGLKRFHEKGMFYVGDACGAIEPLSGDGIIMAMSGSFILVDILNKVYRSELDLTIARKIYKSSLRSLFNNPLHLGRILGYCAIYPKRADRLIQLLEFIPPIFNGLVRYTRIPSQKVISISSFSS